MTDNIIQPPSTDEDEGQRVVACGECESHSFAFVVTSEDTWITCLGCGTRIGRASISDKTKH